MGEELIELTLDKDILEEATKIFEVAGLTTDIAIDQYLKKVVESHGIQFLFSIEGDKTHENKY